jgi:ligand-binding sensor domain-containing protein/signal transduction histidine kinase
MTAQELRRPLWFEHIGLADGLSQSSVYAIVQDHKGFLWFGTEDGLNRYDGYTFTVYRHDPQNTSSISANFIHALMEDSTGVLWVGTEMGGLNRFDRRAEAFTAYRHDPHNPSSLSDDGVFALCQSRDGAIWVGTANGLNRLDARTGKFTRFVHNPHNANSLSSNRVTALCEDRNGSLWVGTNAGLNRFNARTGTWTQYNHTTQPTGLSSDVVRALHQDRDGDVWIGTWGGGLNMLNTRTGTIRSYTLPRRAGGGYRVGNDANNDIHNGLSKSIGGNVVWDVRQDAAGLLWIATEDGGLSIFNKQTETFAIYRQELSNARSLSVNMVRALCQDNAGSVWVGTGGGGINKFDPRAHRFLSYRQEANNPNSLTNNIVRALYEDTKGVVWIGTEGGGLNAFDRRTGLFTAYRTQASYNNKNTALTKFAKPATKSVNSTRNRARSRARSSTIHHDVVRAIFEDHDGALWIGTGGGGLNHFQPRTGVWTAYRHDKTDVRSLGSDFIRVVYEDHTGTLWIGTEGGGLNAFDRRTGHCTRYTFKPDDAHSLSHPVVLSLCEDRFGVLWVGTLGGLNKFNRANGTFERYLSKPGDPRSLSSNNIRCLLEDKAGNFWVGTWGGGFHLFDRSTGTCTVFREKDGLPNDAVYGMLEDAHGNLWLSTNKGIARFTPATRKFRVYNARDGLQSNEFNSAAYHHGRSGRMYFGGVMGFSEFFPDSIHDNTFVPPVILTGLKKFNKPVRLNTELSEMQELVLPHSDNVLTLQFASLSFTCSEKNSYKYILEGFDKDWIEAGSQREAVYTNLDAGTYRFRVIASNNDGVWNEQGATLRIVVMPPWWNTLWFRAVAVVSLVSSGGAWMLTRVRRVQAQNRRLERLVAERTAALAESNGHLSVANHEIQQHLQTLSEQSWEIATINTQLHARNQELERLNKEKNEFLSIAAHDLKNPLTSIVLSTEIIRSSASTISPAKLMEKVATITTTAIRMRDIINDLLGTNALETGALTLYSSVFDVALLVQEVVQDYTARAAQKHITLLIESSGDASTEEDTDASRSCVYADMSKTREVLDNLVSNAIKYSPAHRRVWVCIVTQAQAVQAAQERAAQPVNAQCVLVTVRDEGPGLTTSDQAHLFKRFTRLSARPTGGEHSTGLGLSIVKKLAEAMNGAVWCESTAGEGATFVVQIPKAELAAPQPHSTSSLASVLNSMPN